MQLPWIRITWQVPWGLAQKHHMEAIQARQCWRLMQCSDKPTPGAVTSSPLQDLYLSLLHAPSLSSTCCSTTGPMIWGVKSRLRSIPHVWSSARLRLWFYPVLSLLQSLYSILPNTEGSSKTTTYSSLHGGCRSLAKPRSMLQGLLQHSLVILGRRLKENTTFTMTRSK